MAESTGRTDSADAAALGAEYGRLRAAHRSLCATIELWGAAREVSTRVALAHQRAAHDAERRAWERWSALRDARRADRGDLSLVARADQAEAAHRTARAVSDAAAQEAAAVTQAALEQSARDSARLSELGARCRDAQDRYLAAMQKRTSYSPAVQEHPEHPDGHSMSA